MKVFVKYFVALILVQFIAWQTYAAENKTPSVNTHRAVTNYILNCQGCHLRNGEGSVGGAPSMVGVVANFLNAPGGREFLLRVPGVASTRLDSEAVAELMNWLIYEFDAENVPANFIPFTTKEVEEMRQNPYVQEAEIIRKELVEYLHNQQQQ